MVNLYLFLLEILAKNPMIMLIIKKYSYQIAFDT